RSSPPISRRRSAASPATAHAASGGERSARARYRRDVRSIAIAALALAACGAPDRGPPCAPGTICTVAGTGEQGIGEDGLSAHQTDLYLPVDVARGPDGRMFIVDFNNHRVLAVGEDWLA